MEKLVEEKVKGDKKDLDDLVDILDTHFDPEKAPPVPADDDKKKLGKARRQKKKPMKPEEHASAKPENKENIVKMAITEVAKDHSETDSPDTTTLDSPVNEESNGLPMSTNTQTLMSQS